MKKDRFGLFLIAIISLLMLASVVSAQEIDTRIWSQVYWQKLAGQGLVEVAKQTTVPDAVYTGSRINARTVLIDDSPDVPVIDDPNTTQSENSIFVNPLDNNKALNSNNSTENPVGNLYGTSGFMTSDFGLTWGGSVQGTGGPNSGDPAACISLNGRYYVGYIADDGGNGTAYSTDEGQNWTHVQVVPNPGSLADKNHLWVDNSPSSPHQGNLYATWTNFSFGANDGEIELSRSTDGGLTWSSSQVVSSAVNAGSHNQGVNVSTGPNGEVYVTWSIYDSWPSDETAIGFTKSLDGGATFDPATRIITNIRGIRTTTTSKNHRVASFPVMDVDITGGPRDGRIYIVWTNYGTPGINNGPDIDNYIVHSDDGGASWSSPVRVNQDPPGQGNEHYMAWLTCDPVTGNLSVIMYDDRNVSSTMCEVFVANSTDGGATWEDFKVSDVAFTPSPIPGLAGGYFGDYIGISARGGKVYPVWTDNRTGTALAYVSPFALADPTDPNPPAEVKAYSDYSTPTEIAIAWTDPTSLANGDTLLQSDFNIQILRDNVLVDSVNGGIGQYTDTGLNDGQVYSYTFYTKKITNDSLSLEVNVSWTAGGAREPKSPTSFSITQPDSLTLMMHWTNPSENIDGTPMDDFDGINLYEDGSLVATYSRAGADTGKVDSASYTPPAGTHQYYVTAFDNESPSNESNPSNTSYSPLSLPFFDDFATAGVPNPGYWLNVTGEVNAQGDNPPSAPNVLNLDGNPNGGDEVTLLPVDLTDGTNGVFSYWWQPEGLGDTPESGDDLFVDFLNDQGTWVQVRQHVGSSNQPFKQEVIVVANENPGSGATFFHPGFQMRFRNSATSGDYDDWNIDNVEFGPADPSSPTNVTLTAMGNDLMIYWTNPSTNVDGSPMDDFDAINLYEDGVLLATYTKSPGDTGKADSALFTPSSTNLPYYLTAVDNESPPNESAPSQVVFPPVTAPYTQDFEGGVLPQLWTNEVDDDFDWSVDAGGTTSSGTGPTVDHTTGTPQGYYMYTESSSPNYPNYIAHLTTPFIDITNLPSAGMAFWYHMHGAAMGELHVDVYANGTWNLDVMPPLVGQQQPNQTDPWLQAVVDLSAFSGPIQVRFRGITGTSFTSDMAIDDVFFGSLAANPQMATSPISLSDTLLVGATSSHTATVSNIAIVPTSLSYTVNEIPPVTWLSVMPSSGTVTSGQTDTLNIDLDATGLSAGTYTTDLIIAGNDTSNSEDTIAVALMINDAPVISITPDTFNVAVSGGEVAKDTLNIKNSGLGPLYFFVGPGQPAKMRILKGKSGAAKRVAKVDNSSLSKEMLAEMARRSTNTGRVNASDESMPSLSGNTASPMMPDQINGEEIFGSTASSFSGGTRTRGNIFHVTTATNLIEHRMYLNITTSTDMHFFVYEGTAVTGTYNLIDDIFVASSGSGQGFYSSGPTNVPLEVGKYYYIGAGWNASSTYYRGTTSTPIPTSFGTLETGIPGDIAGGYPPAPTANNTYSSGSFSPYYCAIVTGVGIDWITANPDSGVVAAGDSADIELTFDATGLESGSYNADVVVSSNDPVNPEMRAGVHMQVGQGAAISVSADSIDFDTTYVGFDSTISFMVTNIGGDTLDVSGMLITDPAFSVDTASFRLAPSANQEVKVTFAPTTQGPYSGWIFIASNDPVNDTMAVRVKGVGSPPVGIAGLNGLPTTFDVSPNYPNPFNPTTTIKYQLPQTSDVKLVIFNVLGQKVRTLVNTRVEAGYHSIEWDGRNDTGVQAATGIYIYRFQAEDFLKVQKMILMK